MSAPDPVLALRLVRAAAPVPRAPDPRLDFLCGPAGEQAVEAWVDLRRDWQGARGALGRAQRRARNLNSGRRRFYGDQLMRLARHERTYQRLLGATGFDPSSRRGPRLIGLLAAVYGGLPLELAAAAEPDAPWEDLADAAHVLTGWVLRDSPPPAVALAEAGSVSDAFAAGLLEQLSPEDAGACLRATAERAPFCLRARVDAWTPQQAVAALAELGVDAEPSPWSPWGIRALSRIDVNGLAPVRDGRLTVQDEASQLVAAMLAPEPGERVLDLCAGAYGKTLALAEQMAGKGRIDACDVRESALRSGSKRARAAGFTCIRGHVVPPDSAPALGEFDRVLLDAPCTGTGAVRRQVWNRWLTTGPAIAAQARRQAALLERAAGFVRPGGRLVYATCSLLRAENEGVLEPFLASHPEFTPLPLPQLLGAELGERLGGGGVLRTWPHRHGSDGFFAVALRRSARP